MLSKKHLTLTTKQAGVRLVLQVGDSVSLREVSISKLESSGRLPSAAMTAPHSAGNSLQTANLSDLRVPKRTKLASKALCERKSACLTAGCCPINIS